MLKKRPERRDSCPRADHDHGGVARRHVKVFGRLDVNGHLVPIQLLAVTQEARRQPIFGPVMRGVIDHGDRQVHLAGVGLGRRRNRVEPRRDLVEQRQDLGQRELDRVVDQHIGVIPREDVIGESLLVPDDLAQLRFLFAFRQFFQHRLNEFLADAVQHVLVDEQVAQRDGTARLLRGRGRIEAQVRDKFIGRLRKIARNDRQRIARGIVDAAGPQMHDDVPRVLGRALGAKRIIFGDPRLERVGPVMNGGRRRCAQKSGDSG